MHRNSPAVLRALQSKAKENTREDGRKKANDDNGNGDPSITRLVKVLCGGAFLIRSEFTYMLISTTCIKSTDRACTHLEKQTE